MKLTKIALFVMALMAMVCTSGCGTLSYMSLQSSKDEIRRERAYATGDQKLIRAVNMTSDAETAIRAVALDDGGVGIGIDVSNLSALKRHPLRQIGAAVVDAGSLWGTYLGVKSLNDSGSHEPDQTAGRDNNSTVINGSGNVVNNGDQTTTPAPAE